MVNTGLLEAARSLIEQAVAKPLPAARAALLIGCEQDARDAFGTDHGLQAFFRERAPAVIVYELPGAGGVLPNLSTVTVDGLGCPAPKAAWHRLEVSYDAQASPPVTCRVDGGTVELERQTDGVWRPRRTESGG